VLSQFEKTADAIMVNFVRWRKGFDSSADCRLRRRHRLLRCFRSTVDKVRQLLYGRLSTFRYAGDKYQFTSGKLKIEWLDRE
jgi:hypothetical protein